MRNAPGALGLKYLAGHDSLKNQTDKSNLKSMITSNAKAKIKKFNRLGLPSNIVAEAVYKRWWSLLSPFYPQYLQYIISGLISFEMETLTGPDRRSRYNSSAGDFLTLLRRMIVRIHPLIAHLVIYKVSNVDLEKEEKNITSAYRILVKGLGKFNASEEGELHVSATRILHFINPQLFLSIDGNAAKAFQKTHNIDFKNTTHPEYSSANYFACLKCAQLDILTYGISRFCALEISSPIGRIYDKLSFINGLNGE